MTRKKAFGSHRKNFKYYVAGSVSLITFVIYLSSLQNEFIFRWDDGQYIIENPFIRSLDLTLFKRAFSGFYAANWHPLTWISHALDYALWGLNPLGHHLTNNILHAINTFLVVVLTAKLLEAGRESLDDKISPIPSLPKRGTGLTPSLKKGDGGGFSDKRTLIAAATTGLLFGLHPLHVESVAWVAERKDLLCALFFLGSVMTYTKYVSGIIPEGPHVAPSTKGGSYKYYSLSLGFFTLALLSKPMAVSLPIVLLILEWYPFRRIRSMKSLWSAFIGKLPFIALSLVSSILTILAQKRGGAMAMTEFVPLSARALVAAASLMEYLWKIVLPINLSPYYPYPRDVSLLSLQYLSAVVIAVLITAACAGMVKKQKVWLSAWGYYAVTLIPVIGIVQVGGQAMADRYTYLPGLGPSLVIGLAAAWVSGKMYTAEKRGLTSKLVTAGAVLFVFVAITYLTVKQIRIWKNDITLWSYVIEKQPTGVPQAYNNRGLTFVDMEQFDKAMEDFDKAIASNPGFYEAFNHRGGTFEKMGQFDKAIDDFDKAISLNPRYAEAYYNRGVVYGKTGSFDASIASFNKSLELDPGKVDAYVSRGVSYAIIGKHDKALKDFNEAIDLNQNYAKAYLNRANLYSVTGRKELAIADFQKACDLGDQGGCNALKLYAR